MHPHSKLADLVLDESIARVVFRLSALDTEAAADAVALSGGVRCWLIPPATDQLINQNRLGKNVLLCGKLVSKHQPGRAPASGLPLFEIPQISAFETLGNAPRNRPLIQLQVGGKLRLVDLFGFSEKGSSARMAATAFMVSWRIFGTPASTAAARRSATRLADGCIILTDSSDDPPLLVLPPRRLVQQGMSLDQRQDGSEIASEPDC